MPAFDGTGPRGAGPMTGGGRGYCAVVLPQAGPAAWRAPYGYVGLQGVPLASGWPSPRRMPGYPLRGRGGWGRRGRFGGRYW
jgi:hypothetical protein